MVDSADLDRIDTGDDCAKAELSKVINEPQLKHAPLLVLANKQDLSHSLSISELTKRLGLNKLKEREWYIQSAVATQAVGLYEGLDWLSQVLSK